MILTIAPTYFVFTYYLGISIMCIPKPIKLHKYCCMCGQPSQCMYTQVSKRPLKYYWSHLLFSRSRYKAITTQPPMPCMTFIDIATHLHSVEILTLRDISSKSASCKPSIR